MPSKKVKAPPIQDDVYEMESIIAFKQEKGTDYYKIKWKNYPEEEATWEPRKNIIDPDEEQMELMKQLKKEATTPRFTPQTSSQDKTSTGLAKNGSAPTAKLDSISADGNTPRRSVTKTPSNKSHDNCSENGSPPHTFQENSSKTLDDQENLPNSSPVSKRSKEPFVVNIREVAKKIKVFMHYPDNEKSSEGFFINIEEARTSHKDALLDYLLPRVRFKSRSKSSNNSACEVTSSLQY